MELIFALAYVSLVLVLVLPNVIDIPIHIAMLSTSLFVIIVGAHRSLQVTIKAVETGTSQVKPFCRLCSSCCSGFTDACNAGGAHFNRGCVHVPSDRFSGTFFFVSGVHLFQRICDRHSDLLCARTGHWVDGFNAAPIGGFSNAEMGVGKHDDHHNARSGLSVANWRAGP